MADSGISADSAPHCGEGGENVSPEPRLFTGIIGLGLNLTTRFAGTSTGSRVRGFRARRGGRHLGSNTANPRSSSRLPSASSSMIASRKDWTISLASGFGTPHLSATRVTISLLLTVLIVVPEQGRWCEGPRCRRPCEPPSIRSSSGGGGLRARRGFSSEDRGSQGDVMSRRWQVCGEEELGPDSSRQAMALSDPPSGPPGSRPPRKKTPRRFRPRRGVSHWRKWPRRGGESRSALTLYYAGTLNERTGNSSRVGPDGAWPSTQLARCVDRSCDPRVRTGYASPVRRTSSHMEHP